MAVSASLPRGNILGQGSVPSLSNGVFTVLRNVGGLPYPALPLPRIRGSVGSTGLCQHLSLDPGILCSGTIYGLLLRAFAAEGVSYDGQVLALKTKSPDTKGTAPLIDLQIFAMGAYNVYSSLQDRFGDKDWITSRLLPFLGMGLSAFIPIIHATLIFPYHQLQKQSGLNYYYLEGILMVIGVLFLAVSASLRSSILDIH